MTSDDVKADVKQYRIRTKKTGDCIIKRHM